MFFLPFSAKHALYQLRDVTQYILALGGLAVSNPSYVVFIIYDWTNCEWAWSRAINMNINELPVQ